ncbi:MAG: DUF120 domain-containing protein [Deltaproteobacteria bacterium]|nr:DUF120 domain-containing protein [Deltaproteobacteria bacterium]
MIQKVKVKGRIFSGIGKGKDFVKIDWVEEGIERLVGIRPYPGTLNLRVDEDDFHLLMEMRPYGFFLESPNPQFCSAILLKGEIEGYQCALVFPQEDVWVHKNTLEVVSSIKLKDRLGLKDGDEIELEVTRTFRPDVIIFDVDGTLIDSIDFFYQLSKELLQPYGISPTLSQIKEIMNRGLYPWEILISKTDAQKERLIEEAKSKDSILFPKLYSQSCRLFPGVKEVIGELKSMGIKTAIVTTTWDIEGIASVFYKDGIDIKASFDSIHTVGPIQEKERAIKEAIKETLSKLSIPKHKAIYVGDGEINVKVGRELKIATVGVLTGVSEREDLIKAGADVVIDDLGALLKII